MPGRELAKQMIALRLRIHILYRSACTDDAIGHHGLQGATSRLLQKHYVTAEGVAHKLSRCGVAATSWVPSSQLSPPEMRGKHIR